MKGFTICMAATALLATVGCNREPDYEKAADDALSTAALSDVDAEYNRDARTIHLTGTVTSEDERARAGDVVARAVGDGAQVANEVTVAGLNEQTADDLDGGIESRLEAFVDNDPDLAEEDISFDVNNGIVTITGTVASAGERDRVGQMAAQQPGARDVVNSLEIKPRKAN